MPETWLSLTGTMAQNAPENSVYAAFRFQRAPGGIYYTLGILMASLFNFAYLFELSSTSIE